MTTDTGAITAAAHSFATQLMTKATERGCRERAIDQLRWMATIAYGIAPNARAVYAEIVARETA